MKCFINVNISWCIVNYTLEFFDRPSYIKTGAHFYLVYRHMFTDGHMFTFYLRTFFFLVKNKIKKNMNIGNISSYHKANCISRSLCSVNELGY